MTALRTVSILTMTALVWAAPAFARQQARTRQAPAAAPAHKAETWLVCVSHRIDLRREAQRMVKAGKNADVKWVGGPRFVINLALGMLVDDEGHVVTRLGNLDPATTDHDLNVTTSTGGIWKATFVGVDQPTGLTVLQVPELRGKAPAPPAQQSLVAGAAARVVVAQFRVSRINIQAVERVAIYPGLVPGPSRVTDLATPAQARSGAIATVEAPVLASDSGVGLLEDTGGVLMGLVLYVTPGRGRVLAVGFVRDVVVGRVVEANGTVQSGWLGANGTSLANVPAVQRPPWAQTDGVLIQTITYNGPADKAGLKRDDLVVGFDGVAVHSTADLWDALGTTPAGTKIELNVVREGGPVLLAPVLGFRPQGVQVTEQQALRNQVNALHSELRATTDEARRAQIVEQIAEVNARIEALGGADVNTASRTLGLTGRTLTSQLAESNSIAGGVQVEDVRPGSAAAEAGFIAGDLVVRASAMDVRNTATLDAAILAAATERGATVTIEIRRKGSPVTVTLKLDALVSPTPK